MAHRWTEAQNRLLIRLVMERPCLWQKNNPDYQVKQLKDASWKEIDKVLGTNGACRRFKSLRDDFTRYSKGTRRDYNYTEDMSFLRSEIGHRNNNHHSSSRSRSTVHLRNHQTGRAPSLADTTIELLDESDESDGLYEEVCEDEPQPTDTHSTDHLPPPTLPMANYFIPKANPVELTANNNNNNRHHTNSTQDTAQSPRTVVLDGGSTDWQAPVDSSTISREDYQYCKTIISAMSVLPKARQRALKSQIYHLVVETCNSFEADQAAPHFT